MTPGDLWLGRFPLGGTPGVKLRPVLVLTGPLGPVPEFVTAYVSSVIPDPLLPSDLLIDPATTEFASSGLKQTSVVRLHKLATLHQRDLVRRLGSLSPTASAGIRATLRAVLHL